MTNNELLTKETNEIIKSALTGGTFEYLANSVAKQLPTRADGSTHLNQLSLMKKYIVQFSI